MVGLIWIDSDPSTSLNKLIKVLDAEAFGFPIVRSACCVSHNQMKISTLVDLLRPPS